MKIHSERGAKMEDGTIRSSHIGLQVRDLDQSIAFYENHLGFRTVSRITLENGMRIGFIELPEQFQIELVEDTGLKPQGDGIWNHVCMRVPDFEAAYRRLTAEGICFETEVLFMKEFWDHGMRFAFSGDRTESGLRLQSTKRGVSHG